MRATASRTTNEMIIHTGKGQGMNDNERKEPEHQEDTRRYGPTELLESNPHT